VFLMNAQCGARASSRRDRLNVAKLFQGHVTMIASRMSDLAGLRVTEELSSKAIAFIARIQQSFVRET
jgi:hypothetical protein